MRLSVRLSTLLLLLVLLATGIFVALNWDTIATPSPLSFGFTKAQLPLGLVMLGLLVVIAALFVAIIVYVRTSSLLEVRRYARESQASRELADQAEASRLTELRSHLEVAMSNQASSISELKSEILGEIQQVEESLRGHIERSGNALSAEFAELQDRLEGGAEAPPTASTPSGA